jgi:hypothetical protein
MLLAMFMFGGSSEFVTLMVFITVISLFDCQLSTNCEALLNNFSKLYPNLTLIKYAKN